MRRLNKLARNIAVALTITGLTFGTLGFVAFSHSPSITIASPGDQNDPDVG